MARLLAARSSRRLVWLDLGGQDGIVALPTTTELARMRDLGLNAQPLLEEAGS